MFHYLTSCFHLVHLHACIQLKLTLLLVCDKSWHVNLYDWWIKAMYRLILWSWYYKKLIKKIGHYILSNYSRISYWIMDTWKTILLWHLDYMALTSPAQLYICQLSPALPCIYLTSLALLYIYLVSLAQLYIYNLLLPLVILSHDLDTHYIHYLSLIFLVPISDPVTLSNTLSAFAFN